jgi:hypothetical protein
MNLQKKHDRQRTNKVPRYISQMNCKIPASLLVRVTYSNMTVEDTPKILPLELFFASPEELRTMF